MHFSLLEGDSEGLRLIVSYANYGPRPFTYGRWLRSLGKGHAKTTLINTTDPAHDLSACEA